MANMRSRWDGLSLLQQFALMACIVVGTGTVVLGRFVYAAIEAHVVHNGADATLAYFNNLDQSYLQELTTKSTLSEQSLRALDDLFKNAQRDRQLLSINICLRDGR